MKLKIYSGLIALGFNAMAQQNPTGTAPPANTALNLPAVQNMVEKAWYRGGNFAGGSAGINNVFGTMWNSPIYTQTAGQNRMKLNGNITYPVGGTAGNRNGFLLLTNNPNIWTGGPGLMSASEGAFSLLHLVGDDGGALQTFGFRPWMRNGITMSNNFDAGFIGVRKMPNTVGGIDDVSDFVINWSDNVGSAPGIRTPDNLVFNFTTGDGSANDDLNGNNLNGRETMRHTSDGFIGIGPRFNNSNQPKSTLHQHQENSLASWMQITNQASPILNNPTTTAGGPTAITANDGLKWGIDGTNVGYLYNQENKHLLFSTNHNAGTSAERMRITHIGAPGTPNPSNVFANDLTRVSISHDPTTPINRPLALLHLGYNTGSVINPLTTDGWRSWMDVGAFVSRGSDNMYMGLKPEGGAFGDRQDAVISFGDNYTNVFPGATIAPDKLRIIFTSPLAGQPFPGPGAMSTQNGLEFVRYVPFHNASLNVNDPRTGFGDFENLLPVGTINPGNTIEINSIMNGFNAVANTNVTGSYVGSTGASGLRFRDLTSQSAIVPSTETAVDHTKVLSVDNLGNVVLINGGGGNGVGNYCGVTPTNPLTDNYEIPMNIYNYYFTGQGTGRTNVGVGLPCNTNLGGKVHAYQLANNFFFGSNLGVSVSGRFDNYTSVNAYLGYGVVGNAAGPSSAWNIGVYGTAANAGISNFAGYFDGDVYITGTTTGVGAGSFSDKNIKTSINTLNKNLDIISKLRPVDYKYDNTYAPQLKLNNHKNYGFIAQEVESIIPEIVSTTTVLPTFDSLNNIINPEKVVKALNYDGLIPFAIGGIQELNAKQKEMQANLDRNGLSDAQVKTNVNSFNALAKINTLNPVQYNFTNANVPQLNFKSNIDYGFVAQQLETVYPELVDTLRIDATYDSLGVVVNPSQVLKTVNYKAIAGLLVRSIQEQQLTIDSLRNAHSKQDSVNQAVQQQLATLASLINACCSNTTATRQSNSNINQLDVELSDKDAIVLNQNVPNPFAEQTTITYNVPASVGKAQIIFFNNLGQVIQTVDIKTRGKGKVNVFASDLSSGLYNYTLVADGKVIDSKKMVRE